MAEQEQGSGVDDAPGGVNPGYAAFQIAKALTTRVSHRDPATRERAQQKISKWETVLGNIMSGSVDYGSRAPVEGVPAWATLEVITGGFATGALLAGGPLQPHERRLLEAIPDVPLGHERWALNAHYLTEAGLTELQEMLRSGCYDVSVPEEGALLVIAWLVQNGRAQEARELLDTLAPYLSQLRFYPIPLSQPRRFGARVHLQDVDRTLGDIRRIRPNRHVRAQKDAAAVWTPVYDRAVALFLETMEDGWPCRRYATGWRERSLALLGEFAELKKEHGDCGKLGRRRTHAAQLLEFLQRAARRPHELSGREVGRIRLILNQYVAKRGMPGSPAHAEARRRAASYVSAPGFHEIARVLVPRLAGLPQGEGLDDIGPLAEPVNAKEAANYRLPEGTAIPATIRHKLERSLNDTVEALVERGLITSGETLATVLPQMTSGLRAAGITDPQLRPLYAAIYRAFRRRRSLLLLNLEKQVQLRELPWIAAIEPFRRDNLPERELARQALEEITALTLTAFPHAIIPNKLLQELRALAAGAKLDVPLVDELAADIFRGKFSDKFVDAAKRAAGLLQGSLYARYYGIDYAAIRKMPLAAREGTRKWYWPARPPKPNNFAELCAARAGVSLGTWNPATNGMVIEQQHILTTQNLAALFAELKLADSLHNRLAEMARLCFIWICARQQMRIDGWHARLIMVKNTAYAWRQMVFFLSLLPPGELAAFLAWAQDHFSAQTAEFRQRFAPALRGLALAANGTNPGDGRAGDTGARRFLGWSDNGHWLVPGARHE